MVSSRLFLFEVKIKSESSPEYVQVPRVIGMLGVVEGDAKNNVMKFLASCGITDGIQLDAY